jgi:hypothetical protein
MIIHKYHNKGKRNAATKYDAAARTMAAAMVGIYLYQPKPELK